MFVARTVFRDTLKVHFILTEKLYTPKYIYDMYIVHLVHVILMMNASVKLFSH